MGDSAVPAQLGLKATALAWLEVALAFSTHRPGQSHQPGPGSGLAWPRPWLLYVKCSIFFLQICWAYRKLNRAVFSSSNPIDSLSQLREPFTDDI